MIDTHLHLWEPARFDYPWLDGFPALNRASRIEEYREACGQKFSSSIFIECAAGPDSLLDEAKWALDLASHPDNQIAGVVASVWPERGNFRANLQALIDHPLLKGIRRVLHTEADDLSRSCLFRSNVSSLAERNLSFDLCVLERQLPLAIELVDSCPGTQFILDHCGVPDIATGSPDFWRTQITELAKRHNVACKVSGLLLYAGESERTAGGILPWFSHVIETFGWQRVVWGGDWPVSTMAVPLDKWISVTDELLDLVSASPRERDAFLDANARNFYHL
jgi:predicted TIM-barrel fold metal-dependent hydrolase